MIRIKPIFKAARTKEALAATNKAFKKICLDRISKPKYQSAAKKFIKLFGIKL